MKLLQRAENEKIVRIVIGNAKKGDKGLKSPTKTISLIETDFKEVVNMIENAIDKEVGGRT